MMLDVHLLHPFQPSSSRKPNRENRIKNACFSNSHSNIAPSNDKRPLFVQILAIPSASLVSTSLPIQCLLLSNFFFCRGIFPNSFLRDQILMTHELFYLSHDQILMTYKVLKFSCDRILMTREVLNLSREQTLITQYAFYLVHELTNLSEYPRAFSGHKEAPSGFAYFCPRNRKGVSADANKPKSVSRGMR